MIKRSVKGYLIQMVLGHGLHLMKVLQYVNIQLTDELLNQLIFVLLCTLTNPAYLVFLFFMLEDNESTKHKF